MNRSSLWGRGNVMRNQIGRESNIDTRLASYRAMLEEVVEEEEVEVIDNNR